MITALSIGGSSTTGAAGVGADLKTFAAFGIHSAVVITAIASQNTKGVQQVFLIPPEVIGQQIDSVFSDMRIGGVKVGMVGSGEIARTLLEHLSRWKAKNIVFDPVMSAQSDQTPLADDDAVSEMRKLAGVATVVTPNRSEAQRLTGVGIRSTQDAKKAAEKLKLLGAKAVVVKGVRAGGRIFDVALHDDFKIFGRKAVRTGTHGGGCCFSSALAACLVRGMKIEDAVEEAELFMDRLVSSTIKIGGGIRAVDPMLDVALNSERWRAVQNVKTALEEVEGCEEFSSLIPEVGTNIVCALPGAKEIKDVAGVVGRVRNAMGKPKSIGRAEFGASSHLAGAVLKIMEFDPSRRGAVNIKLTDKILKKIRRMGLTVSHYERGKQPAEVKEKEGRTIQWGVEWAVRKAGRIPDVIYHKGEMGKEPSIIIFSKDAVSAVRLARRLLPKG